MFPATLSTFDADVLVITYSTLELLMVQSPRQSRENRRRF